MGSPIESITPANSTNTTSNAVTSPIAVPATSNSGTNASIGSTIADFQEKAPEVVNAMELGIATTICSQMKDSQDRIKEINREARST